MMKKYRQLHLWIGLLTSFLILIEAVTGLIMTEPWLLGTGKPSTEQRVQLERTNTGEVHAREAQQYGNPVVGEASEGRDFNNANKSNNLMGFIRGLHSGRIGTADISIFLDIAAIALIFLTITGIILSTKALKAQILNSRRL